MNYELLDASDYLLGAGLNGLYQGLIVTGIVGLCLRWGRTNAATRHAVWFATLILVAALIPAHMMRRETQQPRPAASEPPDPGGVGEAESTWASLGSDSTLVSEAPPSSL